MVADSKIIDNMSEALEDFASHVDHMRTEMGMSGEAMQELMNIYTSEAVFLLEEDRALDSTVFAFAALGVKVALMQEIGVRCSVVEEDGAYD